MCFILAPAVLGNLLDAEGSVTHTRGRAVPTPARGTDSLSTPWCSFTPTLCFPLTTPPSPHRCPHAPSLHGCPHTPSPQDTLSPPRCPHTLQPHHVPSRMSSHPDPSRRCRQLPQGSGHGSGVAPAAPPTLSMRISLSAIFRITGSSSDSRNFLMATICPVSLLRHLKTTP